MRNLAFLFYFIAMAFGFGSAIDSAEDRPNFIIVMTDDQGFGDLGVHGNDQIDTLIWIRLRKNLCGWNGSM